MQAIGGGGGRAGRKDCEGEKKVHRQWDSECRGFLSCALGIAGLPPRPTPPNALPCLRLQVTKLFGAGGSVVKHIPSNAGDTGSIPGLGRSPGGEHGSPLLYSCQDNPVDREAWWATLRGVAESYMTEHAHTSKLFESRLEVESLQPCRQENHLVCLVESACLQAPALLLGPTMLLRVQTLRRTPGSTCCPISDHSQRPLGHRECFHLSK